MLNNQLISTMGSVKNNGGARAGAGRKSKAVEQKLIEKLSPLDNEAFKQLKKNIANGEKWAIELFFKYKYGMPKQSIDQNTNINLNEFDISKIYDPNA